MTFSFSKEFASSSFTGIENSFITDYMPLAPGEAVKVYLYGLFLCNNPKLDQSLSDFASSLSLTEQEVISSFKFWEDFSILTIISVEPFRVEYMPIKGTYNQKPKKYKAEKYTEFSKGLQALIQNRMIYTNEFSEYYSIMETYKIKPDAMLLIVKYCVDKKGGDIGYHYISKVCKDFGARGLITVEKVEKELSSYLLRSSEIEKILKALSLKRQPDIEDQNYFKKWTEELDFEPENIIFAASKTKKGGMAKLDEFLLELYSKKCFSKEEIARFIADKKAVYELAVKINKNLSIYVEVLDPVIDVYLNKWLSYGYEENTLLYIASICFKTGKNSLKEMDELIEQLKNDGFIDFSSVGDYFENDKKTEEFLKKILNNAGVNRRPTSWDKENLKTWKNWNFSDEMIMEASTLSAGKSSPTAYMNGILSNWKNNGIFSLEKAQEKEQNSPVSLSQEAYNIEYKKRRANALALAQENTEKAMNLEGFSTLYERLFSIEKDLAFAEISNNSEALKSLNEEQNNLNKNLSKMLKTIGLDLTDLTPKYKCEKCNDTGYVGTNRCDCFDKYKI